MLKYDNIHPYTANLMTTTLSTMGWESMNHPPYRPDSAPCDFQFFSSMKVHLRVQTFQTDDELNCGVLNWLCSHNKTCMLLASVTCQDGGKNILV
jgi:hypothetical protein